MRSKKLLKEILLILILSSILGFGWNFSLIKKYFQGEYRHAFLSKEEYPSIAFITLAEAEDLFSQGEALFIDSRSEKDFKSGHIPGAVNIPAVEEKGGALSSFSFPKERTLVVYCDGSECQSSVFLAKLLHQKGLVNIKVFFGGWVEWIREGLPVALGDDQK